MLLTSEGIHLIADRSPARPVLLLSLPVILQTENAALRAQIAQLQQIVSQLQGVQYMAAVPAAVEQPLMMV